MNWWYLMMGQVFEKEDRPVSAGEVAKFAGYSINTARKYLELLKENGVVGRTLRVLQNGVKAKYYYPYTEEEVLENS